MNPINILSTINAGIIYMYENIKYSILCVCIAYNIFTALLRVSPSKVDRIDEDELKDITRKFDPLLSVLGRLHRYKAKMFKKNTPIDPQKDT